MGNTNSKSYLTSLIIKEIYIITGTRYTFKNLVKMQSWKRWTIFRIVKNICKQALLHTIGSTRIDILFLESNLAKVIQFSIFTSFDQAIILLKVYCKDILYTSTERGRHSCNVVIKKYEIVGIHFIFLCIAMHTDMVR